MSRLDAAEAAVRPGGPTRVRRAAGVLRDRRGDAVIALALLALGLVARWGALPDDGLIFDDAWVAIGAAKAEPRQLLTVSTNHPGFTAFLMAWSTVLSGRTEWMAYAAVVAGAALAPALYLLVRRMRVDRVVAVLAAGLIVVAPVHVQYSGRIKTYVFEGLLVVALALLIPRLAGHRWRWATAAGWAAGAVLVSTVSAFCAVAVGVAGVVLAAHARADRWVRWPAVLVQGAVQLLYLQVVQRRFDSGRVTDDWEEVYDGYIEIVADPLRMTRQLGAHMSRVGAAVVEGNEVLTGCIAVVAVLGLAGEAWRGRHPLRARFLLALPVVALAGALVRQVPFGPAFVDEVYPGTRATLWLLPSLAAGLALSVGAGLRLARRTAPRTGLPVAGGLVVVAVLLVGSRLDDAPAYPSTGARSAHELVVDRAGPDDVVILLANGIWHYASVAGVDVRVVDARETLNGFEPRFVDTRIWVQSAPTAWDGSAETLQARVGRAPEVFVLNGYAGVFDEALPALESALASLGYRASGGVGDSVFVVSVWERSDAAPRAAITSGGVPSPQNRR